MRNKKLRWLLAALIGVPLVLLVLYVLVFSGVFILFPTAEDYTHRIPFETKAWRDRALDGPEPLWPTRLRMIDDLMATRRLETLLIKFDTAGRVATYRVVKD